MTEVTTDNATLMKSLYEAFGRGDVPTVLAAMDDRIEWSEAENQPYATERPLVGPQEVLERVLTRIGQDFDGFRIDPGRFISQGDTVVMLGRYRADRAHATGKPLDAPAVHAWDLRGGKLVRFQQYTDTQQMTDVLGAAGS
jgi:ketosteroid isomerase-like protein